MVRLGRRRWLWLLLVRLRASTLLRLAHFRQGVARMGWTCNHVVKALLKIQLLKFPSKFGTFLAMLFDKSDEFIKVSEQDTWLKEVAADTRRRDLLREDCVLFVLIDEVDQIVLGNNLLIAILVRGLERFWRFWEFAVDLLDVEIIWACFRVKHDFELAFARYLFLAFASFSVTFASASTSFGFSQIALAIPACRATSRFTWTTSGLSSD